MFLLLKSKSGSPDQQDNAKNRKPIRHLSIIELVNVSEVTMIVKTADVINALPIVSNASFTIFNLEEFKINSFVLTSY